MSRLTAVNLKKLEDPDIQFDQSGNKYISDVDTLLGLLRVKGEIEVPDFISERSDNGIVHLDIDARLLTEMLNAYGGYITHRCKQRDNGRKTSKLTHCTDNSVDSDLIRNSVDKIISDGLRV